MTDKVSGGVQEPKREFVDIGKAWVNEKQNICFSVNKMFTDSKGVVHNAIQLNNVGPESMFVLTPNKKREGKKDADYRVSLLIPVAA